MPLFQCVQVPSSVGSFTPRVQPSCSRNSLCSRSSVGRRHRASAVIAGASAAGSAWPLPSGWAAQASASAPQPPGASQPKVVVTREKGKNDQLMQRLKRLGIETVEMPLIKAEPGPDRDRLPEVLASESFDWVCLTSPEAAAVFTEGWRKADCPKVQVAAVGVSTERALRYGLQSQFHPSKANAVHFAAELPIRQGGNMKVLYPASVRAGTDLQQGLAERGFAVTRLNTYNTASVSQVDEQLLQAAMDADAVAVASPSAVKALLQVMGKERASTKAIACIGSTSAKAATEAGLSNVFYPPDPGFEGWCSAIQTAVGDALPGQPDW